MIKTDICVKYDYNKEDIKSALCAHLPIDRSEIRDIEILKKTLKIDDDGASYALAVGVSASSEKESGLLKMKKKVSEYNGYSFDIPTADFKSRPVVVGAGPAGLFCALVLAEAGARPIIIERGEDVEKRAKTVKRFFGDRILSEDSNIQFGEGGAGAFSDGKLKVGGMDKYKKKTLAEFVSAGAPEEILYTVGAHLGTDKLPSYVKKIREKIISLGAEFRFSTKLCDLDIKNGEVRGIYTESFGSREYIEASRVILAIGHSAKDTFERLFALGVPMVAKGFGIGVRIEHPREYINKLVYKNPEIANSVGTASYHLVSHLPNGRSLYSFCMCPGGEVVAAASESGGIVTNGMSEERRMAENSNAAHLVSVTPEDFGSDYVLAGMELQRKIEREAFVAAGANYSAPAESMESFLSGSRASLLGTAPSYPIGVTETKLERVMPPYVTETLKAGLYEFDKWLSGFILPTAAMTAPETRTTSPIRILRSSSYESVAVKGLYPTGEGAGYAGGIVSSAADGIRCAESIILAAKKV